MIVMVLDRKWVTATVWALIAALFALFGIVHVPQAGFDEFSTPTYEQCWNTAPAGEAPAPVCWNFAQQWMFFVGYIILAAHFAIIEVARRFIKDDALEDILDDPSAHAFDDWFADATKTQEEFEASKHLAISIKNGTALPSEMMSAKDADVNNESSDEVDL